MFEDAQLADVFELLTRVAKATVQIVGPNLEMVMHDLRNPSHCVVGLAGNLTKRKIGAPLPDAEFLPHNLKRFKEDYLLYPTRTPGGRRLLSSTVFVRNKKNAIVGALCINIDKEQLKKARDFLNHLLDEQNSDAGAREDLETFAADPKSYVAIALRAAEKELGKSVHDLEAEDKVRLIGILDQHGVFRFRQAIGMVSQAVSLSRASIYQYLKKSRSPKKSSRSK